MVRVDRLSQLVDRGRNVRQVVVEAVQHSLEVGGDATERRVVRGASRHESQRFPLRSRAGPPQGRPGRGASAGGLVGDMEQEWAQRLGPERFAELRTLLVELNELS